MNKPVLPMSSLSLRLPTADRSIETYRLAASRTFPAKLEGTLNRVAFSAAHVVADPLADNDPWLSSAIDWDRTIAFREHVWDLGLGVAEAMDTALEKKSGYIKRSTVVRLAEAAGFKLAAESRINANPKDTHDYPGGVWTLPPTFAQKDVDRAKFAAIGESDRFTLKFVKPK